MIDLRDEFDELLQVEEGDGIGRWIVLRRYTKELTSYWNEAYKEAVGGPQYKFVDTVTRAYSEPGAFGLAMAADGRTRTEPADIPTESVIYYLHCHEVVEKGDVIFELDWRRPEQPSGVAYGDEDADFNNGIVKPLRKAEVLKVINYASTTAGDLEFKKVFAEEHTL